MRRVNTRHPYFACQRQRRNEFYLLRVLPSQRKCPCFSACFRLVSEPSVWPWWPRDSMRPMLAFARSPDRLCMPKYLDNGVRPEYKRATGFRIPGSGTLGMLGWEVRGTARSRAEDVSKKFVGPRTTHAHARVRNFARAHRGLYQMRIRSGVATCLAMYALCFVALFGLVVASHAQTSATGALTGTVTGSLPDGVVCRRVKVTAHQPGHGARLATERPRRTTASSTSFRWFQPGIIQAHLRGRRVQDVRRSPSDHR